MADEWQQTTSGIYIRGRVTMTEWNERDGIIKETVHENTITNWARAIIASFLVSQTVNIGAGATVQPSLPMYIALGTGTGTPAVTDQSMFAETYQTRKQYTFRDVLQAYTAQIVVNYQVSDPNGTFTEAGLWDGTTQTATLGAAANAGATTLTLASGAPSVVKGEQLYLSNGTQSEYVYISTAANAGAGTWALTSALKYSYTSGTSIVVFGGNLMAHVAFAGAGVTKGQGNNLTAQWGIYCQAG